ncbi:MAG: chlorophyll synthesis pathway protein BchC [Pseudomonadota bacterium]|nr:chlorophyll synthesis pathway protein BchC [Pseudomonadota bacterium]
MNALAVVFQQPGQLAVTRLDLSAATDTDVVVDVEFSGISTGTERLLWNGRMPAFPGMGYPLVPGYESVGRVVQAGVLSGLNAGDRVFVPGATCYGEVRGLFGGAASRVVLPGARALRIGEALGESGALLALAATAYHVAGGVLEAQPELIVGHGVLGRLLARLAVAAGGSPVVWETNPARCHGAADYRVTDPAADTRRNYSRICDVSGDAGLLDNLIARLAPRGEVVLAGFYDAPLAFVFAPAFMREARIRIAAQWQPADLVAVRDLAESGALSLSGLITHRAEALQADAAYRTAFGDSDCLKMTLDWRACS